MDAFLPAWGFVTRLDWNSLLSALIGGGLALAGVFWTARFERKARQGEAKATFQRDTLIALQDATEAHVRTTQQIDFWRERPAKMEAIRKDALGDLFGTPGGDALMPPPTPTDRVKHMKALTSHTKAWHESRYTMRRLQSRVDNASVRSDVSALIAATEDVITTPVMEEVTTVNDHLNASIGRLIRRGRVTARGFAAPDKEAD